MVMMMLTMMVAALCESETGGLPQTPDASPPCSESPRWWSILGSSEYSYLGAASTHTWEQRVLILGSSESSTHHTWE